MSDTVKCLSIRHPFAHLILHGGKDVENRTWRAKYRGPIVIHAGKQWYAGGFRDPKDQDSPKRHWWYRGKRLSCPLDAPRGALVGIVHLEDCVRWYKSRWAEHEPEIWHWVLTCAIPFPEPIPYKGQRGLFEVPRDILPFGPEVLPTMDEVKSTYVVSIEGMQGEQEIVDVTLGPGPLCYDDHGKFLGSLWEADEWRQTVPGMKTMWIKLKSFSGPIPECQATLSGRDVVFDGFITAAGEQPTFVVSGQPKPISGADGFRELGVGGFVLEVLRP